METEKHGMIVTIGELLKLRGLDTTKNIKLVRHKDARQKKVVNGEEIEGSPYDWYRSDKEKFIAYQSHQHNEVFKDVDYIVSFIGEEGTLARFVGVYKVGTYNNTNQTYGIVEEPGFDELKERVIIEWGQSSLAWHQWLHKGNERAFRNDKEVVEITPGFDYIFPGYDDIILTLPQLQEIVNKEYPEWKKMLSAVNCIYVIADNQEGRIYIGSTYNKKGIWGRWEEYAKTNGHGNNVELKQLYEKDANCFKNQFTWSILKILPIGISENEAVETETLFKRKLGRKACCLNRN